ncbi:Hypothetical protein, conserved [Brucella suis ATCC 23445]|uniref:Uncharacterized protein n=1 Tax=Brucella suis (strain ATCC 23445 / NCTC 10510) TaxID=470137 RepID=A9WZ06_BRUSI|nr:Hypothetical protein, conserved [Brucella suis ATCC 23445]
MLDHIVRVHNEGVAIGNTIGRTNAEAIDQRTIGISKRPDRQLVEILVVAAPCQLDEFIIGRTAKHNCIAIFKFRSQTRKFSDFRRADEGEVLRVEENDFPLAGEALFRHFLECRNAVFLMMVETGLYAGDLERGKLVADAEHFYLPVILWLYRKFRNFRIFLRDSFIGRLQPSVKAIKVIIRVLCSILVSGSFTIFSHWCRRDHFHAQQKPLASRNPH